MASADFSQFVVTTANETACEISPVKVRTLSLHVPAAFTRTSSNFWTSVSFATLSVFPSLLCGSCPSGQRFAYSFFQIPPRDGHPCCSAIHFPLSGRVRDLHPLERAHGAQTEKSMASLWTTMLLGYWFTPVVQLPTITVLRFFLLFLSLLSRQTRARP